MNERNPSRRLAVKEYTDIAAICINYREVFTVTKQRLVRTNISPSFHPYAPRMAAPPPSRPLSISACFGELSRRKTDNAVATV